MSVGETIKAVVDVIKTPQLSFSIVIAYIVSYFLGLLNNLQPYCHIVGVLASASLMYCIFECLFRSLSIRYRCWCNKKGTRRRLHCLNPTEKEILQYYIKNNTREQRLPQSSGTVNELVAYKIIYRSSPLGGIDSWAYNIHPWVGEYLRKHLELIKV